MPAGARLRDAMTRNGWRHTVRGPARRGRRASASRRSSSGIDPDPAQLWPAAVEPRRGASRSRCAREAEAAAGEPPTAGRRRLEAAAAVLAHCRALIDAAGPACVAVKPQLACFERLGAPGWLALEHVCAARARARPARARRRQARRRPRHRRRLRAGARLEHAHRRSARSPACSADAFTANPLLGRDALEPLIEAAREPPAGVFVLVRTSNPGAADLLDLELATGGALWERLARLVDELGEQGDGPRGRRRRHRRDRARAPRAPARADAARRRSCCPASAPRAATSSALAPAFAPGRAGGLVTASRSIANAHASSAAASTRRGRPRRGRAAARAGLGAGVTRRSVPMVGRNPARFPGAARAGRLRLRAVHRGRRTRSAPAGGSGVQTSRRDRDGHAASVGKPHEEVAKKRQDLHRQARATRRRASPTSPASRSRRSMKLNPDLDPQSLAPGQRIKLSE